VHQTQKGLFQIVERFAWECQWLYAFYNVDAFILNISIFVYSLLNNMKYHNMENTQKIIKKRAHSYMLTMISL
jgi:hypothetical protein